MRPVSQGPLGFGLLLIGLAAVTWGTTGSVTTLLVTHAGAQPLVIGVMRLWIAAALLVMATRVLTPTAPVAPEDRWRCVAMGACMALYQAAYFTAVTLSGITITAVVAICSAPLAIAGLAAALLGERLSLRLRGALALGVLGTALLIGVRGEDIDASRRLLAGTLLALAAGLAYAAYVIIAKPSVARTSPLPLTSATFLTGALFLTPVLAWSEAPTRQIAAGWPWLLYLGGVATAGAYALYTTGLRYVPASVAGVATLVEPLTATLLGTLAFGERLSAGAVVGIMLLAVALGLAATDQTT